MTQRPSYTHLFQLILELRQAALENGEAALARDDGGWGLCLGAALANDAADALEAMLAERGSARAAERGSVVSIRCPASDNRTAGRRHGNVAR